MCIRDRQRVVVMASDGFEATPRMLSESEVAPFVREIMLRDTRGWPVAVLAPLEDGGYIVPPEQLAQELFGLAPLYVICLLYTSPSPRDRTRSRMPSSA